MDHRETPLNILKIQHLPLSAMPAAAGDTLVTLAGGDEKDVAAATAATAARVAAPTAPLLLSRNAVGEGQVEQGTQFTCFTGTKLQILTLLLLLKRLYSPRMRLAQRRRK